MMQDTHRRSNQAQAHHPEPLDGLGDSHQQEDDEAREEGDHGQITADTQCIQSRHEPEPT